MKTREQKIEAIYEKIADKSLGFGCKIKYDYLSDGGNHIGILISYEENKKYSNYKLYYDKYNSRDIQSNTHKGLFKIIGHTIYIGDVLDYLENGRLATQSSMAYYINLKPKWKQKRKPIEQQSTECIDFIYNLLTK